MQMVHEFVKVNVLHRPRTLCNVVAPHTRIRQRAQPIQAVGGAVPTKPRTGTPPRLPCSPLRIIRTTPRHILRRHASHRSAEAPAPLTRRRVQQQVPPSAIDAGTLQHRNSTGRRTGGRRLLSGLAKGAREDREQMSQPVFVRGALTVVLRVCGCGPVPGAQSVCTRGSALLTLPPARRIVRPWDSYFASVRRSAKPLTSTCPSPARQYRRKSDPSPSTVEAGQRSACCPGCPSDLAGRSASPGTPVAHLSVNHPTSYVADSSEVRGYAAPPTPSATLSMGVTGVAS